MAQTTAIDPHPALSPPSDPRGRRAGSRGQGEKILDPPAKGVSSPSIYGWRTAKMYFLHYVSRNTTSLFLANPFMDGVSPLLTNPCPLPLVDPSICPVAGNLFTLNLANLRPATSTKFLSSEISCQ